MLIVLEPLADAWVEVVHDFPVEGVAGVVVEVAFAVWDVGGDLFAHP